MLSLLLVVALQDVTLPAVPEERRWVLASAPAGAGAVVVDEQGRILPAQVEEGKLWFLVERIPANAAAKFSVKAGTCPAAPLALVDAPGGWISVRSGEREITRYHHGALAEKHKKPFWWPLNVEGVNILRGAPMEPRPGEAVDHPHHTGIYHAFGEVNGKEYWSKLPIVPVKVTARSAGPAFARLVVEHRWGEDLLETQEIRILNAAADVVVDFQIVLKAANGPVVLGKDLKMAKEGSFAVRVAAGLSLPKGDAPDLIRDAKGNKGEKAVRADTAPWVQYTGTVDGKKVGVAVMNHPDSFRYPTTWHVRAYGLFAANPWLVKGESRLEAGESLKLGYRVYAHGGEGSPAAVYQGYRQ
jgi:hypothetical protein